MARTFATFSPRVSIACTWEESLTFLDEDRNPVDLTGYVVEAQIRATLTSASALNLTSEWTIPTPTDGTIVLEVAPEDFKALLPAALKKKKYLWAIVLRRTDDDYRIPLAKGSVTFTREAVQYADSNSLAP
jgi:hypothetical protein